MKVKILILGLVFLFAIACTVNCDNDMAKIRSKEGSPEEINRYDSTDYHSIDWWYWSKGICYTFKWGSSIDGCEVSTYKFSPITESSSRETKKTIKENK